ncbi:MAG TPA: tRNA pseudouridine(55) synthase TruB [Kofleriaceae bacterium]|jgi:tRNA pseudouridine55 synthase|nr:tRNA pseudouridine(55) synthase TruB [Kofleriaceae bacterium]
MHGILVLDKPAGMTSATAVDRVRRELGGVRAGHGGTLDPIATGVLPICLGSGTKLAQFLLAEDKAYLADGVLGVETDTLDRTGRVIAERAVEVTRAALAAALAAHLGSQTQIPPMYSAIKQGGVRLYDRARAGEEVERAPRQIRVDRLELLAFEPPRFRIAIACSKGTYVRSLVADVGTAVGAGAHLAELRRTRSGRFTIEQAVTLDRLGEAELVPPEHALDLPRVTVPRALVAPVLSGAQLPAATWAAESRQFQLLDEDGRLLAVAHADADRTVYDRVFPELIRPTRDVGARRGSGAPGA